MPETSRSTALDTVLEFHRAWTSGDIDAAMDRVAEDVVCRAPGEDLTGKDAYREYLAGFAPALTGLAEAATFAEEDRVALFYYPQTAATSTALAAECFTVRGNMIVENLLVFDRMSFGPPDQQ